MAALVGEDYLADGHIGMAHLPNPADAHDVTMPSFQPTPEREVLDLLHLPLANDCVRFVGEAVAMVVAETLAAARDAAEAVAVGYQILPAGTDRLEKLPADPPRTVPPVT